MVPAITPPTALTRGRLKKTSYYRASFILGLFVFLTTAINAQFPPPSAGKTTGVIWGAIVDPQGRPVVGVPVWAIRTFPLVSGSAPITVNTQTDLTGKYYFLSLVPGSYRICVSAEGQGLLDPCAFSEKPPTWNLHAGQSSEMDVAMTKGAFIHLRFDDPKGAATALQQSSGIPPIRAVATTGSGKPVRFFQVAQDAGGRNLRALVPFGETLQLSIQAAFTVLDANGNATKGVLIPVAATTQPTAGTPVAALGTAAAPDTPSTPGTAATPGTPTITAVQEKTIRFLIP